MSDKRTQNALLAKGIDSDLAERLVGRGHTVASLKSMRADQLAALGLSARQVQAFTSADRPPIPQETLISILSKSRWTCCVCKDRHRGIIVHHIEQWADSKSHDESNLVVLCLDHHGEAHTKRELSLSLDPDRLRALRDRWYQEAVERTNDTQEIDTDTNHVSRELCQESAADAQLARGLWLSLQDLRWEICQLLGNRLPASENSRVLTIRTALLRGDLPTGAMWPSEVVRLLKQAVASGRSVNLLDRSPVSNFKRLLSSLEAKAGAILHHASGVVPASRLDVIQRLLLRAASARRDLDDWVRSATRVHWVNSGREAEHDNSLIEFFEAVQEAWDFCAKHGAADGTSSGV